MSSRSGQRTTTFNTCNKSRMNSGREMSIALSVIEDKAQVVSLAINPVLLGFANNAAESDMAHPRYQSFAAGTPGR
jgi:hypothetical protein